MSRYQLITGVQSKAVRVCIYGQAGIGKTTLAAEFPNPVFIDVEDGSNQLPVARMPRPTSWAMLMDEVKAVRDGDVPGCSTLVLDTADAAETLCVDAVCSEKEISGIEDMGYGKGYTYLAEKFGKLLDLLGEVVESGRNVVVVSHALCRKFERPDESGAYDRYELKLSRKVAPMVKEWADMLLFLDYKIIVETESDRKGNVQKAKARGGQRIIRTTHHPCWDAKNRFGIPAAMPLSYDGLAPYIPDMMQQQRTIEHEPVKEPEQAPSPAPTNHPGQPMSDTLKKVDERIQRMEAELQSVKAPAKAPAKPDARDQYPPNLKPLADLMRADDITDEELRRAMGQKGYRPFECAVTDYPQNLIEALIASWDGLKGFVIKARQTASDTHDESDIPF